MKTYKQSLKTPKGGWVKADLENMQALASEQIGLLLCLNPVRVYEYGMKKNITLETKLQELHTSNFDKRMEFVSNIINFI